MKIPFVGGAYNGRVSNVAPETCINYYVETTTTGMTSLVSTPGDTTFNSDYAGEVRGGILYNGLAYFVIGDTLYEFDSAGTGTSRGTLGTSSGRVSMAHNGARAGAVQQIMIADGVDGYIYNNVTQATAAITDTDMTAPGIVVFFDGYFVFTQVNSDRFWITNQYDGTTIDTTDFFTAEGDPDQVKSLIAEQRQLFVFGEQTTEGWYNSGDADSTLQRFQGGYSQTGTVAAHTPQRFDNSVVWLSQNERGAAQVVRMGEGFQPAVLSTPEVNYQLSTYTTIDDAFSYTYQSEGHEFYVLTFPTADRTWVYDAKEQQWHRRAHTINGVLGRERYNCHVYAFNKHLMGDFANGKIYVLDSTTAEANGARVERERTSPPITLQEQRTRLASVQLDMQEGVGDPNNEDDLIWLSYSKDGGHVFTDEIARNIGDTGEYAKRIIWRRLGSGFNWIFRTRTWTPKAHVIKGLIGRAYGTRIYDEG